MKRILILSCILALFCCQSIAQRQWLKPQIDVSVGYMPKAPYHAGITSVAFNNFIFKRMGLYTSLEKSFSSDYFSNIFGITGRIHKYFGLWAGLDFYTKVGIWGGGRTDLFRKELGVSVYPYKNTFFKFGYSSHHGPTAGVGLFFPL